MVGGEGAREYKQDRGGDDDVGGAGIALGSNEVFWVNTSGGGRFGGGHGGDSKGRSHGSREGAIAGVVAVEEAAVELDGIGCWGGGDGACSRGAGVAGESGGHDRLSRWSKNAIALARTHLCATLATLMRPVMLLAIPRLGMG